MSKWSDIKMYDLTIPIGICTPAWPTYEPLQMKFFKRLTPNGANGQLRKNLPHLACLDLSLVARTLKVLPLAVSALEIISIQKNQRDSGPDPAIGQITTERSQQSGAHSAQSDHQDALENVQRHSGYLPGLIDNNLTLRQIIDGCHTIPFNPTTQYYVPK